MYILHKFPLDLGFASYNMLLGCYLNLRSCLSIFLVNLINQIFLMLFSWFVFITAWF